MPGVASVTVIPLSGRPQKDSRNTLRVRSPVNWRVVWAVSHVSHSFCPKARRAGRRYHQGRRMTISGKFRKRSATACHCCPRRRRERMTQRTIRIGVSYAGNCFALVSDCRRCHHPRQARIPIAGFHDLLRHEIANRAGRDTPARFSHIAGAHCYRGRFAAEYTESETGRLLRERRFDDALMKARVTTHFMPMAAVSDGKARARH